MRTFVSLMMLLSSWFILLIFAYLWATRGLDEAIRVFERFAGEIVGD